MCTPAIKYMVPWAHTILPLPSPKNISIVLHVLQCSPMCQTQTEIDRHTYTDHATPPVAIGRIYAMHAMRSNNWQFAYSFNPV